MTVRGIRGAITVEENIASDILENTKVLLETIIERNHIDIGDIISIFFSVTPDLDATFPALSAREMGMTDTPLLCLNEINVPGSLNKCIRILIHVNSSKAQSEMLHVYLKKSVGLRPDKQNVS